MGCRGSLLQVDIRDGRDDPGGDQVARRALRRGLDGLQQAHHNPWR